MEKTSEIQDAIESVTQFSEQMDDGKNITTDTTITAQYEKISTGGNAGGSENPDAGGNAGGNDNPDTGDSSNLILWSVLGIASLLCVAVLLVILYRKKGKPL